MGHQKFCLILKEHQRQVEKQGAQKLTRENLKVAWAKFSTLSEAVFAMCVIDLEI